MPRYCAAIDTIKVRFEKDATVLEYISEGDTVETQTLTEFKKPRPGDTLSIKFNGFLNVQKTPKQYSIEDLMRMIEEKKG